MPRKLKTYQTSLGFFDLAIAAPSMKAALEAWDSKTNLFHQGLAKEADDPAIIAATMAKPGVVLKRAVGSSGSFGTHAELPENLAADGLAGTPEKHAANWQDAPPSGAGDDKAARAAMLAYEREKKRRDVERNKQAAAQAAERKRRDQAIAKAEAALKQAKQIHDTKTNEIAVAQAALDRQSEAEETRWTKQRSKLENALNRALTRRPNGSHRRRGSW